MSYTLRHISARVSDCSVSSRDSKVSNIDETCCNRSYSRRSIIYSIGNHIILITKRTRNYTNTNKTRHQQLVPFILLVVILCSCVCLFVYVWVGGWVAMLSYFTTSMVAMRSSFVC